MRYFRKQLFLIAILFTGLWTSFSSFAQNTTGDNTWPREVKTNKGVVVIYQPQVETLTDLLLEARTAIAVTPKGENKPVFGAAWFTSQISTERDTRMVSLTNIKVTAIKFPGANEEDKQALVKVLEKKIPKWTISLSLDRLITSLDYHPDDGTMDQFNNQPPEIIYAEEPSILVVLDGDPIFKDLTNGPGYLEIINTPFFLVSDATKKTFYLYGGDTWYTSHNLDGEWGVSNKVPYVLANLVQQAEKEKSSEPENAVSGPVKVFLRTHPAELIQAKGKSKFSPVKNTNLLYMTNSEDDILMDIGTQQYYVLISGRWYHSSSLTGNNWIYAPQDQLPEDFAKIPAKSEIGNVRANVAGTPESRESILDNTIPQTAEIDRNKATVEVSYDGNPQFERIKGTDMEYAVNTDKSVMKINNRYYCCNDAVWFVSNGSYGPWRVCVDVPNVVQDIPPEYPIYNVKYVHIYQYTPQVVYVGYTPAYLGSYVHHGTVIYGTGYNYRPWYRYNYYARPITYGFGVHYHPYTGWGFSYGVRHGWFHTGYGYRTVNYARGGWWGPGGYATGYRYGYGIGFHYGYSAGWSSGARAVYWESNRKAYNTRSENIYKDGVTGVISTRSSHRRGSTTNRNMIDAQKQVSRSSVEVPRQNNVYTDENGQVYRRTNNGWQKRDNNRWTSSGTPSNQGSQTGNNGNRRTTTTGNSGNRASTNSSGRASTSNQSNQSSTNQGNGNRNNQSGNRTNQGGSHNNRSNTGNFNRNYNNTSCGNLKTDYHSRSRGTERTQNYRKMVTHSKPKAKSGTAVKRTRSSGKSGKAVKTGKTVKKSSGRRK